MLALIAGRGALPCAVARARPSAPLVAALEGFWPEDLTPDPELVWRVETLGTLLQRLRARGVREVCLCGAVERPSINMEAIDAATLPLIPVLRHALGAKGDDGVLRAVMDIFETAGLRVRAAHEVAPSLLPPPGVLSRTQPPADATADAALGDLVSAEQGRLDLGQACVISQAQVIAREDTAGTDAMLASLVKARPDTDPDAALPGGKLGGRPGRGMFYKAPKPGQDRRADLPVVGPATVEAVARAGLAGLTLAADGVMVLERARTIAACDAHGLYLWVRAR